MSNRPRIRHGVSREEVKAADQGKVASLLVTESSRSTLRAPMLALLNLSALMLVMTNDEDD